MKKLIPYILIALVFVSLLFVKYKNVLTYKFDTNLVTDYLRSQDIEDIEDKIKDRVILSDSDLYIASGYLYAKGEAPTTYDFQVPALIKYLFGFSILLTGNPYWVQVIFGLALLYLTYFLSSKLFKNKWLSLIPVGLLLIDPVFLSMQENALLDLGTTVFALAYVILVLFYPQKSVLAGIVLGLLAASKFWSIAAIFVVLIYLYLLILKKDKIDLKKTILSFIVAGTTFSLIYIVAFIKGGGDFNIFFYVAKVTRYMLSHNSAGNLGGTLILFVTGFFKPWWQEGIQKALEWSVLWPIGLLASIIGAIKEFKNRKKGPELFIYLLPITYLLSTSTQVPFSRYFLVILPFIYISLTKLLSESFDSKK